MSRREKLQAMLAEDPQDEFLRYSLGLEWLQEGEFDRGLEMLAALARQSPPYVPAFFMAAQHLAKHQDLESARCYLRDGIEAARQAGDHHAAAEMSEFLASL